MENVNFATVFCDCHTVNRETELSLFRSLFQLASLRARERQVGVGCATMKLVLHKVPNYLPDYTDTLRTELF